MRKNKHFIKFFKKENISDKSSSNKITEFGVPITDICVCCGRPVPEGSQVCYMCKKKYGCE